VTATTTAVERGALEPAPAAPNAGGPSVERTDRRFWVGIAGAVALGAAVRFAYLFHGAPRLAGGDGFGYHFDALRLADGLGYTSSLGNIGEEHAHHPPGWVTLLAGVSEAGGRSMWAHQVTGIVIGLVLILVAGLVGRRYAGSRVGVLTALVAAVYPGFWVLEAQVLSEPLGLLVVGLLMLVLADLWDGPTLWRAILAGAVTGALGLVRSEQFVLLVIAVVPILLLNPRISVRRRLACAGAAIAAALIVIAPWTIYNLGRFEEPILLSSNVGSTLLAGNCPPSTYSGELLGFYTTDCVQELGSRVNGLDRTQRDVEFRRVAMDNLSDNLGRLPDIVAARYGRVTGVFRPSQTVGFAAAWLNSPTWPVWAWVASFWLVAPLAVWGSVILRRSRTFQWPLIAPVVIVALVVAVSYGEPRYHTPADLGLVALAAVAISHLVLRARRLWSVR
jgi:4-amino-4-deoxy-L-arabinose transferase-like glycosyltransferase